VLANATSVLAAVGDGAGDGVSVGGNGVGGSAAHVNYDIEALYREKRTLRTNRPPAETERRSLLFRLLRCCLSFVIHIDCDMEMI
jgi:hypothetical protein